ncbi:hypothetical protein K469DRAFT_696337 [Zopfia rhizophila CBS 207.26]|uniref:DUF676 domain-containing protein n=1 Tax=Zopfia rhizophila CBS 207.26 TaxID=1314779 RepID=A0A6A6DFT3_9PEZI|nr:hypothetical protein K469DRAFT_696337 [Zopfia rhizophila CBS 207.26]
MSWIKGLVYSGPSHTEVSTGLDTVPDNELYATDGPTGIKVVTDPSDAVVDIVFVHGLTGNREKTWTHRNGTFWPRALLSEDLLRARIMTFGYDADVVRFWTLASSNRLDDHGKSLVYALLDQREQVGQRPIIFVAHSLGGLVCEEALNLSDKRQSLNSIRANTLGIVFMGTPHGGSYLASWGKTVTKYVNIFRGTNQEILNTLQPGSSDLQRTEEDFQHILRRDGIKIKVFCFYEAVMMNGTVGKIVERESAILAGYDSCSINADHRNMTKFTGRADEGYGQVRAVLKRWIDEHVSGGLNSEEAVEASTANDSRGAQYNGPVFNGPISGHNVMPGYVNNGTANFNFS